MTGEGEHGTDSVEESKYSRVGTDDGIVLCWVGPRQSDVFHTGLFDVSITLFGDGYKRSNELSENKQPRDVRKRSFNVAFCIDSPLRWYRDGRIINGGAGIDPNAIVRIDHNENSDEQGAFIALEQLALMAECKRRRFTIRFMNYNPNYIPRNLEKNPEFKLLAGIDSKGAPASVRSYEEARKEFYILLGKLVDGVDEKDPNGCAKTAMRLIREATICRNKDDDLMELLDDKYRFRMFCKPQGVPTTEGKELNKKEVEELERALTKGSGEEDADGMVSRLKVICKEKMGGDRHIIQIKESSGGNGTFFLAPNESLTDEEKRKISDNISNLVVSKFFHPNISVNVHAVIGEYEILLTKPSIQIIMKRGGRLLYCGADYVAYDQYKEDHEIRHNELVSDVMKVSTRLQSKGYRGIIGFDAIISHDKVMLVEANNRFQASTYLLNKAFSEVGAGNRGNHLVPSMQALNIMAFLKGGYVQKRKRNPDPSRNGDGEIMSRILDRMSTDEHTLIAENFGDGGFTIPRIEIENIPIGYSNYIYYHSKRTSIGDDHARLIHDLIRHDCEQVIKKEDKHKAKWYEEELDGLDRKYLEVKPGSNGGTSPAMEPDAYLYKLVLHNGNIVSAFEDSVSANPNIPEPAHDIRYWDRPPRGLYHPKKKEEPEKKESRVLDVLDLKIQLINRGARIDDEQGARPGVNSSRDIDLFIFGNNLDDRFEYNNAWYSYLPVNCPTGTEIARLSPFEMKRQNGDVYSITYYGRSLCFYEDDDEPMWARMTPNDMNIGDVDGIPFQRICFLATDRLRIQHSSICRFVQNDRGCKFCELTAGRNGRLELNEADSRSISFDERTIDHAVARAFDNVFRLNALEQADWALDEAIDAAAGSIADADARKRFQDGMRQALRLRFAIEHEEAEKRRLVDRGLKKAEDPEIEKMEESIRKMVLQREKVMADLGSAIDGGQLVGLLDRMAEQLRTPLSELASRRIFTHILIGGATLPGGESKMLDRIVSVCKSVDAQKGRFSRILVPSGIYRDALERNPYYVELVDGRSRDGNGELLEDGSSYTPQTMLDEMSIYLMSIPMSSKSYIDKLFEHGVTEVGFNIEIFTHNIAARAMPGKCEIPLSQYVMSLNVFSNYYNLSGVEDRYRRIKMTLEKEIVKDAETPGYTSEARKESIKSELESLDRRLESAGRHRYRTRTAFIVGLDTDEGLKKGIDTVLALGVSPILSIFRPVNGTEYGNLMPPSCDDLYSLYLYCSDRARRYSQELGPECLFCQNNVLALPRSLEPPRRGGGGERCPSCTRPTSMCRSRSSTTSTGARARSPDSSWRPGMSRRRGRSEASRGSSATGASITTAAYRLPSTTGGSSSPL